MVHCRTYVFPDTSAVVTGATDGIGKEFAIQLAKSKFNILLISRSENKLKAVAGEIGALINLPSLLRTDRLFRSVRLSESKEPIKTKTLAIDFSSPLESDYTALENITKDLDVGVLGE